MRNMTKRELDTWYGLQRMPCCLGRVYERGPSAGILTNLICPKCGFRMNVIDPSLGYRSPMRIGQVTQERNAT